MARPGLRAWTLAGIALVMIFRAERISAAPEAGTAMQVVRSFFEAANRADEAGMLSCFDPGAVLNILSSEYRGHASILGFLRRDVLGGTYSSVSLYPVTDGIEAWVEFTPAGWRTSEPPIAYRMRVRGGKIHRLEGRYRRPDEQPPRLEEELPFGFKRYLQGVRTADARIAMEAFAPDARVIDVGRRIDGSAAIHEWILREVIGLSYTLDSITSTSDGCALRLRIRLPGGSTFSADYFLKLDAAGRIQVADLRYAEE